MKTRLNFLGFFLGLMAYGLIIKGAILNDKTGLSFTTFMLWAGLAVITVFTIKENPKADPKMPIAYGIGATVVALILWGRGAFIWSSIDTIVCIMTVLCAIGWRTLGSQYALVLAVTSSQVAIVPFVILTWREPWQSPIVANVLFTISATLLFFSAKTWTLEDRLYHVVNMVSGAVMVTPWILYKLGN